MPVRARLGEGEVKCITMAESLSESTKTILHTQLYYSENNSKNCGG